MENRYNRSELKNKERNIALCIYLIMKIQEILSRFPGWKQTGPNQYIAHCPTREDKKSSLSISVGADGRILLFDHGGEDVKNILCKVGLTMSDLYQNNKFSGSRLEGNNPGRKIVAIYKYLDENETLIAEKVRYEPKSFHWRVPMVNGRYDFHKPNRVPPYNLPVLVTSPIVFLVEGEKDVDTLARNGIPAVSLPDGAGEKWPNEYTNYFMGKIVLILPDNDKVGIEYAKAARDALKKVCLVCAVWDLRKWWPEISEKGDISDYIAVEKETAVENLRQLQTRAKNWLAGQAAAMTPANAADTMAVAEPYLLKTKNDALVAIRNLAPYKNPKYLETDIGSGRIFADLVKGQLRYVPNHKDWYVYNGIYWSLDMGGMCVSEMCKVVADGMKEYTDDIQGESQRDKYRVYTDKWQTQSYRNKIIADSKSIYNIPMEDFDADDYLLNCKNGTLDLRTMVFRAHDPEDKITKVANVNYNPNARCSRFEQFVSEVMSGDEAKSAFLQKVLGYALSGDTRHECMFILYGATTRNGKSTLMESVLEVQGDYGITASPETIAVKQRNSSGPSDDIARLAGRRLVSISEPPRGMRLNTAQVKSMTGNDTITARFLYGQSFCFKPQFKLYINTNYLPSVDDMSLFSSERVFVIPFDRHFGAQEQDPNLKHLFREEEAKSAILNWLIEGWKMLQKDGLKAPPAVIAATEEYSHDSNKVALFAEAELVADGTAEVRTAVVYERYKEWCNVNGCMAESSTNLNKLLQTIGEIVRRRPRDGSEKTTLLVGYRLK